MKKRTLLSIMLALVLAMVFMFSGCAMFGQKIAAEDYNKVMADSAEALSKGSFTIKATMKTELGDDKLTATMKIVVEDGKKAHITGTMKGKIFGIEVPEEERKIDMYMEVVDGKTYEIEKNANGKWVGVITAGDFFDAIDVDPIAETSGIGFEALEYKMGKYHVKAEIMKTLGTPNAEMALVFKGGKLSGYTLNNSEDTVVFGVAKVSTKITIKYSGKVTIPSYEK